MDELSPLFQEIEFHERFRGYDPDEVDAYVDRVAKAAALMRGRLTELQERVEAAESRGGVATVSESEETLTRTLVLAQRTADAAIAEAREEADRLTTDAATSAQAVLSAAEAEATVARRESDEIAAATITAAQEQATSLVAEAESERRRLIDEAEAVAASAAVAERERLAAEVAELQDYREFLADDIEILERHLTDERQHLTASLSALTDLLDSPDIFRSSRPPATSGVTVDEARLAPLEIVPERAVADDDVADDDVSDPDDEGVAEGDMEYSEWAGASDPDPDDRPAVWVPDDLPELAEKVNDGAPPVARRASPVRVQEPVSQELVDPVTEPSADVAEEDDVASSSFDPAPLAWAPSDDNEFDEGAFDSTPADEAAAVAVTDAPDPVESDVENRDVTDASVVDASAEADGPAIDLDPVDEPVAVETPMVDEPAVAAFAADLADEAPPVETTIDLVEPSRLEMEAGPTEIVLPGAAASSDGLAGAPSEPPLLVTAADLDGLPSGSTIGDPGPATAPMPMVQERPLFADASSEGDDPFLDQLRNVVDSEPDTDGDDDALTAFFDHDEDDGGRSWFGRRR